MGAAHIIGLSIETFWKITPYQFGVILKAHQTKKDSRWDEVAWFMYHLAVLFKTPAKNFPKNMDGFTAKALRSLASMKKKVKAIDETAIMARLRAYKQKRLEEQ